MMSAEEKKRIVVLGEGPEGHVDVLLVGEAPGMEEAFRRRPFIGASGLLLNELLKLCELDRKTCWITNAVSWRPEKGQAPSAAEVAEDRPRLEAEILAHTPKVIYCLGSTAVRAVLSKSFAIRDVRGFPFWSSKFACYVVPTWHPAAVLRDYLLFPDLHSDLKSCSRYLQLPPGGVSTPEVDYTVYEDKQSAQIFLRELADTDKVQEVSVDIETDGFNYMTDRILEIGFAWNSPTTGKVKVGIVPSPDKLLQVYISDVLERKNTVWHNGKFDIRFLQYQWNCKAKLDDDTMLMHYALDERQGIHSLKMLARTYFDAPWYEEEIRHFLPNTKTPFSAIPNDVRWKYLAFDVYYTLKLSDQLRKDMKADNVDKMYQTILLEGGRAFLQAELYGVKVDLRHRSALEGELVKELVERQENISRLGEEVGISVGNARSFKQIADLLYDGYKWPLFEGKRSTAEESLLRFPEKKESRAILAFRETQHMIGTFVTGLEKHVYLDGRIHPDVLMHGTVTGRTPVHDPPLQTVDRKKKTLKKLFCASPGYVIADFDYDQLEIRVAAWYSGDKNMVAGFTKPLEIVCPNFGDLPQIAMPERFPKPIYNFADGNDEVYQYHSDFHTLGSALAYNVPWWEVTEDDRYNYKFIIFGVLYGRGAQSLAEDPNGLRNVTVEQAQLYIDGLWKAFPDLKKYYDTLQQTVLRDGEITTVFGRKRRFPFIGKDFWYKIEKQIKNFTIQSTASDINMLSFSTLQKELSSRRWGNPLFTVHDSIVFEVKEDKITEATQLIKDVMTHPPLEDRGIPWEVDGNVGPSWGETKRLD